jgi:predicted AAA+ superfamily ATPase
LPLRRVAVRCRPTAARIIKSYLNTGAPAPIYYYRDKEKREIDLLIWRNGALHPIEIKTTSNPNKGHISAFSLLDKADAPCERGAGGIVCMYDRLVTLSGEDKVIPVSFL